MGIIRSLLDLDRYKLTMAQFVYHFFRTTKVKYAFVNRTKNKYAKNILVKLIPYIKIEINKVKKIRLSYSEMMHLKSQLIFKDEFLEFFSTMQLCNINVTKSQQGELQIEFGEDATWAESIYWETLILSIIAELYARYTAADRLCKLCKEHSLPPSRISHKEYVKKALIGDDKEFLDLIFKPYYENAMVLLENKIQSFLKHPSIYFFEFGTRRRFTAELQEMVIKRLNEAFHKPQFHGSSQFLGTSNEYLAMKLKLKAGGTLAHEIFSVTTGLKNDDDKALVNEQYEVLRKWYDFYGYDLAVTLTDTFGSDYFFKNCPKDIAEKFSFREDSAIDLFEYTEAVMKIYNSFGISCADKVVVHSNGLDKNKVIDVDSFSVGKIHKIYGIGTDLSCDVGLDFLHLSMVIKAVEANGIPLVKLSDNLAKAIGKPEQIERYKKLFGYTNVDSVTQVY